MHIAARGHIDKQKSDKEVNIKPGKSTIVSAPQIKQREDTGNCADDEGKTPRQRRTLLSPQSMEPPDSTSKATRLSQTQGVPDLTRRKNDARTARRRGRRAPKSHARLKRRPARSPSETSGSVRKTPIRRSNTIDTPTQTKRKEQEWTVEDMSPHTAISNSTKCMGTIVGPIDEAGAKQFQKKLKQNT
jgi:hypothetical protein